MPEATQTFYLNWSFWAVIISALALLVAYKSWDTSQKTLKLGIESYEFQNRPWLILNITKNKDTERYYDIVKEGDSIFWKFQIQIENKGLSPAKNIKMPISLNLKDLYGTDKTAPIELDRIVLGQGEKYLYDFSMGGTFNGNLDELIAKYRDNDNGLQVLFPLSYQGLIHPEKIYKTTIKFMIKSDMVSVLEGSEFK